MTMGSMKRMGGYRKRRWERQHIVELLLTLSLSGLQRRVKGAGAGAGRCRCRWSDIRCSLYLSPDDPWRDERVPDSKLV